MVCFALEASSHVEEIRKGLRLPQIDRILGIVDRDDPHAEPFEGRTYCGLVELGLFL